MTAQILAPYVLAVLYNAQAEGRLMTLASLVSEIKVRKVDLRSTVTALHQQGYLDAMTMRLSFVGFALGSKYARQGLPDVRLLMTVDKKPATAAA